MTPTHTTAAGARMARLTPSQLQMLRDIDDGEPTDFAEYADRANSALGWLNRDRVMKALETKGMIDDDNKLTDAGRAALKTAEGE